MEESNFCIVCLTTDVKYYNLKDTSLGQIYSDLTTIPVLNWSQHVCFECAALLRKCHQFKSKCIRSNDILKNLSMTMLTKSLLESLQTQYNLGSNLIKIEISTESESSEANTTLDRTCKTETGTNTEFCFVLQQNDETLPVEYLSTGDEKNENTKQKAKKPHEVVNMPFIDVKLEPIDDIIMLVGNNDSDEELAKIKKETDCDESNSSIMVSTIKRIKKSNRQSTTKKKGVSLKSLPDHTQNIPINDTDNNKIKVKRKLVNNKKAKQIKKDVVKKENDGNVSKKQTKLKAHKNDYLKKLENLSKHGTLQILTQEQAKNDIILRANSNNYINLPHKCDLCFKGFERPETLANHMFRHDPKNGEYECDNCHSRFPTKKILMRHLYCNHRVKFACGACPCLFDSVYDATKHIEYHNGKTYDCKYCEQKFKARNTLSMHIQVKHQNEFDTLYICEFCGGVYINERGFKTHKRKIHFSEQNNKEGPECKPCGVHFASQQAWQRHLVLSWNHNVPNGCKRCGESFETSFELKQHMKIHARPVTRQKQETKTYICQFCGKELKAEYFYKQHLHKVHGQEKPTTKPQLPKKFVCEICGDKFVCASALETHGWKHSGARPHRCAHCGAGFRLRLSLRLHENCHTRSREHTCALCHKHFLRQDSYNRHVRQHKGNIHQCMQCDRSFINTWNLKSHIKRKHEHDT